MPSAEASRPPPPDAGLPTLTVPSHPGIHLLPVLHDRVESAVATRAVLHALDPAGVAVELPTTLAAAARRAAARLPRISVVLSEEEGEDALAWICAPGDPFAEALRWAAEEGAASAFVDPDLPYAERHPDPVPDPHALWELGARDYLLRLARAAAAGGDGGGDEAVFEADRRREAGMAYHLLGARRALDEAGAGHRPLLALLGAAHVVPVLRCLEGPVAAPLARVRRTWVELRHLHPESLTGLLTDAPLAHAVYELARPNGSEGDAPPPPDLEATLARRLSLVRHGFTLHHREEEGWGSARARRVAAYAHSRAARRLAVAGGEARGPDRRALTRVVWAVGSRSWREQTGEVPEPWQRRLFFDYGRRFARTTGQLVPGLYAWVVAARGVGDDNLGWEVFQVARAYPWQEEAADDVETARLDGEDLDLGTRKVRFRRRFFRVKKRWTRVPVREHPEPDDPEEWLRGFDGGGLCSYPPEDVVVEDYGRFLRRRAGSVVAAERERVEPFSTSLLDGIDVRETLRHVEDGRVWVREAGRWPGEAGSVVVIFDRDPDNRFPYLMTWLGEHHDESDMAFYSSHPAQQVVGPGILRATYGGFLMTYPPGRLYDVWRDADYRGLGGKAEVLLAAAVDYSQERLVAHVAAHPPSSRLRHHAAAQGKRIVHIPIGSLSPQALKKIRVLHILVGHDKRAIAGRYVW